MVLPSTEKFACMNNGEYIPFAIIKFEYLSKIKTFESLLITSWSNSVLVGGGCKLAGNGNFFNFS